MPASLARSKYGALEQIGNRAKAIARAIERELDKQTLGTRTGLEAAQEIIQKSALPKVKLPAPLLPSHLLRVAEQMECSILDAVLFIRNDSAATAFREYIWQNRKAFDPIYAEDHLKANELKRTLSEIGKKAKCNSSTGVFNDMTKITINVSNIPVIKELLKIIGKRKIVIPVTAPRNPPLYEVFIARWFK